MPDTLNKQALINLLIDSPLREPIKINLIDIVNNTAEVDLPKVHTTITKEIEIYQKATQRRMKLAEETIAKLGGSTAPTAPTPPPVTDSQLPTTPPLSVPALDLPPLPQAPAPEPVPEQTPEPTLSAPVPEPVVATQPLQPLGGAPQTSASDEDALAEIQKELDSLKTDTAADLSADKAGIASAAAPTPAEPPAPETPPAPPVNE